MVDQLRGVAIFSIGDGRMEAAEFSCPNAWIQFDEDLLVECPDHGGSEIADLQSDV